MFEKIKRFYDFGLYNKEMIEKFVVKNVISTDQYEEITGEAYPALEPEIEDNKEYSGLLTEDE